MSGRPRIVDRFDQNDQHCTTAFLVRMEWASHSFGLSSASSSPSSVQKAVPMLLRRFAKGKGQKSEAPSVPDKCQHRILLAARLCGLQFPDQNTEADEQEKNSTPHLEDSHSQISAHPSPNLHPNPTGFPNPVTHQSNTTNTTATPMNGPGIPKTTLAMPTIKVPLPRDSV